MTETPKDWRSAILKDVTEVPRLGIPGGFIVYGPKAASILTGPAADTLISAAELGDGRTVSFPQGSYIKEFSKETPGEGFQQLVKNINGWVSKGKVEGKEGEVFDLTGVFDFDKVPDGTKVLLWYDSNDRSEAFQDKLQAWVKAGGGLVYGTNPWGYLQRHPDRTVFEIPHARLLHLTGITFTTVYMSGSDTIVDESKAADAHIVDIITKSKGDVSHLVTYRKLLESATGFMPDDALDDVVPSLTAMIITHTPKYHSIPTKAKQVTTPEGRALASLMNRLYLRRGQFNGIKVPPGVDVFPGDFSDKPVVGDQTVTVKAIGAHKDQLYNKDKNWRRWPSVKVEEKLASKVDIVTPFGGLVYLKSPNNSTNEVSVTLKNVVKAPYFDVKVPGTITNWENAKKEPGLWADICGEALRITLPASSIRQEKSPKEVMEVWDSVEEMHVDLRGLHKAQGRREWMVTDEQPSAGYMHSGYPIVTMLDVADPDKTSKFLLNLENLQKNGSWGAFHELGHNMQDSMWTFSGTGEVTCNIFTLHAMEKLTGQKPWEHPWVAGKRNKMETYLKAGADFAEWTKDAGLALAIYAQLARDMGWAVYKKVFREYDALDESAKPKTNDEKIDQWIVRFSKNAGKNLCPMFDFWGFPIREEVLNSIKHLPAFLHDDETTNDMVPERAKAIREKYGIEEEDLESMGLCLVEE